MSRDIKAGRAAFAAGDLARAAEHAGRVLARQPRDADANNLLGACLFRSGRLDDAERCFRTAAAAAPASADAPYNLGLVAGERGDMEEAARRFRHALGLRPAFAGARLMLANALVHLGNLAEASAEVERVLAAAPRDRQALFLRGSLALRAGDPHKAIEVLTAAVGTKAPADWHQALGRALAAAGRHDEALDHLLLAAREEASPALRVALGEWLSGVTPQAYEPLHAELCAEALDQAWKRPNELAGQALRMLRLHPAFAALLARGESASLADCGEVAALPLLHALLRNALVVDYAFETVLKAVRRSALREIAAGGAPEEPLFGLLCSLAQQAFLNEYVPTVHEEELAALDSLSARIEAALAQGEAPRAADLIGHALLRPLHSLAAAERLGDLEHGAGVAAVIRQQVVEPAMEQAMAEALRPLVEITDSTSVAVRSQYEENPYPRWVRQALRAAPLPLSGRIATIWPLPAGDPPRMLIAGCGTGQQSVEAAELHPFARVTAIDLSTASLAYAMRKTMEAGLENVSYHQADILSLAGWDQRFHVIECAGVLHHMQDPLAGWRVLADLLLPGGLMKIGLYSEIARQGFVAAQKFVAERGFPATPGGIRAARAAIAELPPQHPARTAMLSSDFFSASTCRDLLFHVREVRFTIPQIAAALKELGLAFLGFELPAPALAAYRECFPADRQGRDLQNWHDFERAAPATFTGMYQFHVQKPA